MPGSVEKWFPATEAIAGSFGSAPAAADWSHWKGLNNGAREGG